MKKIISATIILIALILQLASCAPPHTHVYSEKWSSDLDHHWHYCTTEKCTELADKAPHEWDEGIVVAEPTKELDGLKKHTCTVCGAIETSTYKLGDE